MIVDTIPISAVLSGMYRTDTYTGIETLIFHTGLNTSRTGYVPTIPVDFRQYRLVLGVPASKEKNFFNLFLVL